MAEAHARMLDPALRLARAFVDRKGTRWRLAALPLGGYVKFHGDAIPQRAGFAAALSRHSGGRNPKDERVASPLADSTRNWASS